MRTVGDQNVMSLTSTRVTLALLRAVRAPARAQATTRARLPLVALSAIYRMAVTVALARVELVADHDKADGHSLDEALLRCGVGRARLDEPFLFLPDEPPRRSRQAGATSPDPELLNRSAWMTPAKGP